MLINRISNAGLKFFIHNQQKSTAEFEIYLIVSKSAIQNGLL